MEATVECDNNTKQSIWLPMVLAGSMFFILGCITWLNGAITPFLQQMLELSPLQASFIISSFYIAVTVAGIPSAMLIKRVGYKNGMAIGCAIMALSALMYIPAAKLQMIEIFLFAQLMIGVGQTVLQTAVNPYVVKMGSEKSAAVRVCIMGLLNKFAGVIVPVIFAAVVVSGVVDGAGKLSQEQKDIMANSLIMPYVLIAALIMLFAAFAKFAPLPDLVFDEDETSNGKGEIKETLAHPHLVLGVVGIALYVAVEVIAADTIGSYALQIGVADYSVMTSYTMACMLIGYAIGILTIPRFMSQQTALLMSGIAGIITVLLVVLGSNDSFIISNLLLVPFGGPQLPDPLLCIALLGFANAMVWPAIWPLALAGLGRLTGTASGLLIMGIAGGALGPLLIGLGNVAGLGAQGAYIVMIPSYVFILFYALKGHKMRSWK
ncbi:MULTISPECIES: N-acetylglucosamine MFS transporter NagP [Pseudoalteromonas]|jgi:fucose permease|uniref:MFS transporter n=2 Tax=Pseudoalteromonas shioyasakiensis TaxID=1190813 RepID=A0ABT6U1G1_9GAMM|nr:MULTISPECIES: MFS transporter [Pseudoalteromonas]MEC8206509.1 MFS transporter [Pseudomonadota bacterium]KPW01993.1 L-fucose-proton symporter [Pseudoalteromonas sp. P1-8]KTG19685.1 MFS transporter [Pseudoalteromonas sp. XI10]KZY43842.1 MFS transporter [Pseudoalteromonas shioyasakiensis]MCF2849071.1 MFS transporter [Pseudoalteromonas sp. PAST1]|tara:strand:+ start:1721 stop:3025 length:1305 start_codon:yes stop_codon:yes gene_type:complete